MPRTPGPDIAPKARPARADRAVAPPLPDLQRRALAAYRRLEAAGAAPDGLNALSIAADLTLAEAARAWQALARRGLLPPRPAGLDAGTQLLRSLDAALDARRARPRPLREEIHRDARVEAILARRRARAARGKRPTDAAAPAAPKAYSRALGVPARGPARSLAELSTGLAGLLIHGPASLGPAPTRPEPDAR